MSTTSVSAAEKSVAPPKLIVVLIVVLIADGLPQEQVQRYRDQFGQGGFRRLLDQDVFTRTQLETRALPDNRIARLMRRAWHPQISGDIVVVTKPFWHFGNGNRGTSHGTPYTYETNVPLMIMGKPWIKAGAYGQYAEIVDIVPTLTHLLRVRPPSAPEGRVLTTTY